MNGTAALQKAYYSQILESQRIGPWTVGDLDALKQKWISKDYQMMGYATEAGALYYALTRFRLDGQSGIVVGSLSPWVEAACLAFGAKKVTTLEYARIEMQHPQLAYVHPEDILKDWEKYSGMDFAFSYSSIEHSGLGRFGDPMDPIGDLREMDKVYCLLKPGGLFFIGVPVGFDTVVFNAHRVYGDLRWPLMSAGYTVVGSFLSDGTAIDNVERTRNASSAGSYHQMVYVLKKDDPGKSAAKNCPS